MLIRFETVTNTSMRELSEISKNRFRPTLTKHVFTDNLKPFLVVHWQACCRGGN